MEYLWLSQSFVFDGLTNWRNRDKWEKPSWCNGDQSNDISQLISIFKWVVAQCFTKNLWPDVWQKFGSWSKECHSFRASCGQYKWDTNICLIEMCELRYKSNFDTYMYCYADFESREMNWQAGLNVKNQCSFFPLPSIWRLWQTYVLIRHT